MWTEKQYETLRRYGNMLRDRVRADLPPGVGVTIVFHETPLNGGSLGVHTTLESNSLLRALFAEMTVEIALADGATVDNIEAMCSADIAAMQAERDR